MKWDFRHHLLTQIKMRRGDISHGELSERLGDVTERCLARYIAGKSHLTESEFRETAKALSMDAHVLAGAWASSLGLRASGKDAVRWISVLWIQRLEKNQLTQTTPYAGWTKLPVL